MMSTRGQYWTKFPTGSHEVNHPPEAPFELDELPLHLRIAAQVLGAGLDLLQARHDSSWQAGRRAGHADASCTSKAEEQLSQVKLILGHPEPVHHRPGKDDDLFGPGRIQLTGEVRAEMRADCEKVFGKAGQPTGEQWKGILSNSPATLVTGGAGTGKTKVLLFRALLLHRYLGIPLEQIQILTFSREARIDLAAELRELFGLFGVTLSNDVCLRVVKTPRSCLLSQVQALPDLAAVIPFDVFGCSASNTAALSDGRPFEATLVPLQREEMTKCLNLLYRSNKAFAALYQDLWKASLRLPRLEVDDDEVVKRAPLGWRLSEFDEQLSDVVEGLWRSAKAWPFEGATPERKLFSLRGRTYSTHGYIPALGLHIVLGLDRSEGPSLKRDPAAMELYKEVAVKRTLLQGYFPEGLIHLDSYQEGSLLAEGLRNLSKTAPAFSYALKGDRSAAPLLDSFNATAALLDALGLEVASIPGRMNFLPDDSDSIYFEALGVYWQALERHLLGLASPVIPIGRLFALFGTESQALRHLPTQVIGQCRHLLIDGAEDQTVPVAGWVRAVISELRRRDTLQPHAAGLCTSLFLAGDIGQWVFGTFGATPRLITDFDELFPCPGSPCRVPLTESFRSPQSIIDASYNLVQSVGASAVRAPKAQARVGRSCQKVQVLGDDPDELRRVCQEAAAKGHKVLILIDSEVDKEWVAAAVGDLIRSDRSQGGKTIRVRGFHKAKALEADHVVLVGDPSAQGAAMFKNQLFKLAGFSVGGDPMPGDTVSTGEALRLTASGIARARVSCTWFPNRGADDPRTASMLAGLQPGLFDDRR